MIIFERETKTLIIPEGLGTESGDGGYNEGFEAGKTAQKAIDDAKITPTTTITENGSYEAPYGFKEVVVNVPSDGDCQEEIDAAYDEGKADGIAEQKAKLTSVSFDRNDRFTSQNGWNDVTVNVPKDVVLGTLVQTPMPQDLNNNRYIQTFQSGGTVDGWGTIHLDMTQIIKYGKNQQKELLSSLTVTENGTYTREDGWNSIEVAVPQEGDCTEAYNQGYEDATGEISSIFIRITMGGSYSSLALINRNIQCDGYTYTIQGAKSYELVPGNTIDIAYTGSFGVKYLTPSTLSFLVRTTDIEVWNTNPDGWEITDVRFNGMVNATSSTYTGGFKASVASVNVTTEDAQNSRITINLN